MIMTRAKRLCDFIFFRGTEQSHRGKAGAGGGGIVMYRIVYCER